MSQWQPCLECALRSKRPVRPRGSESPEIFVVGGGPGYDEDRGGESFSGRAGKDLGEYLGHAGIPLDQVRFSNVVKCFPQDDSGGMRKTTADELIRCHAQLLMELATYRPRMIVAMGATAISLFTNLAVVAKTRERVWEFPNDLLANLKKSVVDDAWVPWLTENFPEQIPVICTYDPSSAFEDRNPKFRPLIQGDILRVKETLTGEVRSTDYRLADTYDTLAMEMERFRHRATSGETKYIVVDVEATGTDFMTEKLVGFSICDAPGEAVFIPWDHNDLPHTSGSDWQDVVRSLMNDLFSVVPVSNQNLQFDHKFLRRHGMPVQSVYFDTLLASWWLYSDTISHKLDDLASMYLGIHGHKGEMGEALAEIAAREGYKKADQYKGMDQVDIGILTRYCCADVDTTFQLTELFYQKIHEQGTWAGFQSKMLDAILPISDMEYRGVRVDVEKLKSAAVDFKRRLKDFDEWFLSTDYSLMFEALAGHKFNPSAWDDVAILIYDVLEIPPHEDAVETKVYKNGRTKVARSVKTAFREGYVIFCNEQLQAAKKTGDPKVVAQWEGRLEVLKRFDEYTSDAKLHKSYIAPLPDYVREDGAIHTQFGIGCTATGRYNSKKPSLHTIPPNPKELKQSFVPDDDDGLVMLVDLKQAELYMLAFQSDEPILLETIQRGEDIHRTVAALLYHKAPEGVTKEERKRAKTLVFGLIYGRTAHAISVAEQISVKETEDLIDAFFARMPGIKNWKTMIEERMKVTGQSQSVVSGRIRLVPSAFSRKKGERSYAARVAVNSPIQASASEITAEALVAIWNAIQQYRMGSRIFSFTHDSITSSVAQNELLRMLKLHEREMVVRPPMQHSFMKFPLRIDAEVGTSWGNLVKLLSGATKNSVCILGGQDDVNGVISRVATWSSFDHWEDQGEVQDDDKLVRSVQIVFKEAS